MTQKELDLIIEGDSWFKERKEPSEQEIRLFLLETEYKCPICQHRICYKEQKKPNKLFQIAHIYPNRPTIAQYTTLKNVSRLGKNSESFENRIALCHTCHSTQDYHTSVNDYNNLYNIKKELLRKNAIKDTIDFVEIDNEISLIVNKLNNMESQELIDIQYNPIQIAKKFDEKDMLLKSKIEYLVKTFFTRVRSFFTDETIINGNEFNIITSQVKTCYLKIKEKCMNKDEIFQNMVQWLKSFTQSQSDVACEIIIAFFVQNCEVFDEIPQ